MILSSLLIVSLVAAVPAARPATHPAPSRAAAVPMVVPFIQDDYAGALADARARGVPLFIEAWAPR